VVVFSSLRGDATLIVPSPRTDIDTYGHLAGFVRQAVTRVHCGSMLEVAAIHFGPYVHRKLR
jgi:tRNA G26 N,N-dimethylase Trm1